MPNVWITSLVVLWVLVLVLAFLLAGALRQLGLMRLRMGDDPGALITDQGLPRGSLVPPLELIDAASGRHLTLLPNGTKTRVLVLLSTGCLACRQLAPHLNEIASTHDELEVVPIVSGDLETSGQFIRATRLKITTLVDEAVSAPGMFGVSLSPFTFVVDSQGRVLARGVANDWRGLESLIAEEGTLQAGRPFINDPDEEPTIDNKSLANGIQVARINGG